MLLMECISTNGRWNFPANTKGYLWNILLFTIIPFNNFQNFFAGNGWCWCCWLFIKYFLIYAEHILYHLVFLFFYLPLIIFSVVSGSFAQINCSIRQSSATNWASFWYPSWSFWYPHGGRGCIDQHWYCNIPHALCSSTKFSVFGDILLINKPLSYYNIIKMYAK